MIVHPFNTTNELAKYREDPSNPKELHGYRISKKKMRQLSTMLESQASGTGFPIINNNVHTEPIDAQKAAGNGKWREKQKQLEDIYS